RRRTWHESSARRTLRHGSLRRESARCALIQAVQAPMGIHPLPNRIVSGAALMTAQTTAQSGRVVVSAILSGDGTQREMTNDEGSPNGKMIKVMRRRIALQSTSCEIARNGLLRFALAFGMRTRPRVALTRCRKSGLILICALLTIAPISIFGAAESSRLPQLAGYKAVQVRYGPLNKMIMSVRINGQPANLLVDTGASQTILDTDAAESFGVRPSQLGLRY